MQDALLAAGAALLQAGGLLAVAPLLKTVIKKMKARLQNRQGPPLLQGYYDLAKLLRKEPVRSEVASWIYVAGPRCTSPQPWRQPRSVPGGVCGRAARSGWWNPVAGGDPGAGSLRARHRRVRHR
jgi:Formate hydrogenlyase subunit 4